MRVKIDGRTSFDGIEMMQSYGAKFSYPIQVLLSLILRKNLTDESVHIGSDG